MKSSNLPIIGRVFLTVEFMEAASIWIMNSNREVGCNPTRIARLSSVWSLRHHDRCLLESRQSPILSRWPNLADRLAIERCLPRAAARGHIASVRTTVATRPLKKRTGLNLLTRLFWCWADECPGSARSVKIPTAPSKRLWRKHTPHFLL